MYYLLAPSCKWAEAVVRARCLTWFSVSRVQRMHVVTNAQWGSDGADTSNASCSGMS